jgi:hypothetical protein
MTLLEAHVPYFIHPCLPFGLAEQGPVLSWQCLLFARTCLPARPLLSHLYLSYTSQDGIPLRCAFRNSQQPSA